MLWTTFISSLLLWAVGFATSALGGYIHLLLLIAALVALVGSIQRRSLIL